MQWPRNRNVLAVMAVVLLAVAVAVIGVTTRVPRTVSDEPLPGMEATEDATTAAEGSLYLLVTAGNTTYAPIRLDAEDTLTLTRGDDTNIIHVTPDSVWMESANCDNQDCVEQGAVTAENRKTRVLGNTIVCLPHRVLLELFTAEELREIGLLTAPSDEPPAP